MHILIVYFSSRVHFCYTCQFDVLEVKAPAKFPAAIPSRKLPEAIQSSAILNFANRAGDFITMPRFIDSFGRMKNPCIDFYKSRFDYLGFVIFAWHFQITLVVECPIASLFKSYFRMDNLVRQAI